MSLLTGKCDVMDHVYMIGSKGTTDEMSMKEKFDIFHKRTGGKLYQDVKVELTKHNIDFFLEKEKNKLKKVENGYEYFGQFYKTLNALNKRGFWTTRTIYFDDMLELFPYLGYIIATAASDKNKETIFISQHEYNVERELEALTHGYEFTFPKYHKEAYKKLLKETLKEMKK